MNFYFKKYSEAVKYAYNQKKIDKGLFVIDGSFMTEIGQCACVIIEDEKFNVIYRLFYDKHLYEMQPVQARG